MKNIHKHAETIPALLYERYRKTPEGIAHYSLDADGNWQPFTWKEYYFDVSRLAKGLMAAGLRAGQNIGIMAPASRQWDVVQMAILLCGGVVVGLDPHDASDNIYNIAKCTDLRGLIVGDVSLLEKMDDKILKNLKFLLSIEEGTLKRITDYSLNPINEVIKEQGLDFTFHAEHIKVKSPATIIFTSGTTGTPKGILYTHGQAVIACRSILEAFPDIKEESNLACWLPLSNLYQRIINYCAIIVGASTYYVENPRQVLQYLPEINPHIFLGVPRFFEKLHSGIIENIQKRGIFTRKAADWAMRVGAEYSRCLLDKKPAGFYLKIKYQLAYFMLLSKLRSLMGSNLKYIISGSAPISQWLLEQFHGIGLIILEAYGISENIIPIAVNRPNSFKFGTVGKLLPGNEIKLTDDGELLVKGPGIFVGYYNDDKTESPLTKDSYLSTGDYAKFDDEGFLILTGRKSEIFKTSTGRRVSPVKIETRITRLSYVEHAVVFGAGKPFLVALLSVDLQKFQDSIKKAKYHVDGEMESIIAEWNEIIEKDVYRETAGLQNFLQPAGLLVVGRPFTIEGGELTANLKIRRKIISEKYQEAVSSLYADIVRKQANILIPSHTKEKVVHWL